MFQVTVKLLEEVRGRPQEQKEEGSSLQRTPEEKAFIKVMTNTGSVVKRHSTSLACPVD